LRCGQMFLPDNTVRIVTENRPRTVLKTKFYRANFFNVLASEVVSDGLAHFAFNVVGRRASVRLWSFCAGPNHQQ